MYTNKILVAVTISVVLIGIFPTLSRGIPGKIMAQGPSEKVVILTDNDWRNIFYAAPIAARYNWPLVIYDENMDNQIENFIKRYNPSTILKLKNEFPSFGFNSQKISRENLVTTYFGDSNVCVVASENDYATSLLAAGYASVRRIPFIFSSEFGEMAGKTSLEQTISVDPNFSGNSNLNYNELFQDYINYAGTEKLIMVDSKDIQNNDPDNWHATLSFLAPIIAGYRQELILDIKKGLDIPARPGISVVNEVKGVLNSYIDNFNLKPKFLTIVADQRVIPYVFSMEHAAGSYWHSSNYVYSEIDDDNFFDLCMGVIIGYSASDANFLILRSIFFEDIKSSYKMTLMSEKDVSSEYNVDVEFLSDWASSVGWETRKYLNIPQNIPSELYTDFSDSALIVYGGHGSAYGWTWEMPTGTSTVIEVGINTVTGGIPQNMGPSLIVAPMSCANLAPFSTKGKNQFFLRLIQSGAVGYVGIVENVYVFPMSGQHTSLVSPLLAGYPVGAAVKGRLNSWWVFGHAYGKDEVIALIGDPLFQFNAGTLPTVEAKLEGDLLSITLPSTKMISESSLTPLYSTTFSQHPITNGESYTLVKSEIYFKLKVPSDFQWFGFERGSSAMDIPLDAESSIFLNLLFLESYQSLEKEFETTYALFSVSEFFKYKGAGNWEGTIPSRSYVFKLPLLKFPLGWEFYFTWGIVILTAELALCLMIKEWPHILVLLISREYQSVLKKARTGPIKGLVGSICWLFGTLVWTFFGVLEPRTYFGMGAFNPFFFASIVGFIIMVLGPVLFWSIIPFRDELKAKR